MNDKLFAPDPDRPSMPEASQKQKTRPTYLEISMFIIEVVLCAATMATYALTRDQFRNAKQDSDLLAERIRKQDSIQLVELERSHHKDSMQIEYARQLAQSQFEAIKKTQEQFRIEQEPYLNIVPDSTYLTHMRVGESLRVKYAVGNVKSVPVKIVTLRVSIVFSRTPPNFSHFKPSYFKFEKTDNINANIYLTSQSPMSRTSSFPPTLTQRIIDSLFIGKWYVYHMAGIEYLNLSNNERRMYWSMMELKPLPNNRIFFNLIISENEKRKAVKAANFVFPIMPAL